MMEELGHRAADALLDPARTLARAGHRAVVRSPRRISQASGRAAIGALAVGALAVGAFAVGAVAIGRLAIGALSLKRGRVRSLTVGELEVRRLRVGELIVERGDAVRGAPVPRPTQPPGDARR